MDDEGGDLDRPTFCRLCGDVWAAGPSGMWVSVPACIVREKDDGTDQHPAPRSMPFSSAAPRGRGRGGWFHAQSSSSAGILPVC